MIKIKCLITGLKLLAALALCTIADQTLFSQDKTVDQISLKGITPYGLEIKEERKVIRRMSFTVEIIYSSELSDDVMGKYMTRFFNELAGQVEKKIYALKVKPGTMKIVISNCRFAAIGYCKKNRRKDITVISYRNDLKEKTISFDRIDIIDRNKYVDLAQRVVNLFFSAN